MADTADEIKSEPTSETSKKVEEPENTHKSVIGFQSMMNPAVLNLLRNDTSQVQQSPVPVSRSLSKERLLKDESILNLQGREVLFATGIFFLVSLSVAFIFIIATTTLEKFSTPTAKEKLALQKSKLKIIYATATLPEISSCKSNLLDFSENDLKGKFGRQLRKKLCEQTLNSLCQHDMNKFRKRRKTSSSKSITQSTTSKMIGTNFTYISWNESYYDEDYFLNVIDENYVNVSTYFNYSEEYQRINFNNFTDFDFENETYLENISDKNSRINEQNRRIIPKLKSKTQHKSVKRFWTFLRNRESHSKYGGICIEKLKIVGNFYKKCIKRRKVSINTLFSIIIPEAPNNSYQVNSLKFFYIESYWKKYALETFFRFQKQGSNASENNSIPNTNDFEVLPPKPLTKPQLFDDILQSLHLQQKDEMEVKMALFRISSRFSKIIAKHETRKSVNKFNSSSLLSAYPEINWSLMLGEENFTLLEYGNIMKEIFLMINFTWTRDIKIFMVWKLMSRILTTPNTQKYSKLSPSFFGETKSETPLEDMCLKMTIQIYLEKEFSGFIEKYYIKPFARMIKKIFKFYGRSLLCNHEEKPEHQTNINNISLEFDWNTSLEERNISYCASLQLAMHASNLSFWEILLSEESPILNNINADKKDPMVKNNISQAMSYNNDTNTLLVTLPKLLQLYSNDGNRRCSSVSDGVKKIWKEMIRLTSRGNTTLEEI